MTLKEEYEAIIDTITEPHHCPLCLGSPRTCDKECLDSQFQEFRLTSLAKSLPEEVLLRIAYFMPPHHCMIHYLNFKRTDCNMVCQKQRYFEFASALKNKMQSALENNIVVTKSGQHHFKFSNVPLYDAKKSFDSQQSHWCQRDFVYGWYLLPIRDIQYVTIDTLLQFPLLQSIHPDSDTETLGSSDSDSDDEEYTMVLMHWHGQSTLDGRKFIVMSSIDTCATYPCDCMFFQ